MQAGAPPASRLLAGSAATAMPAARNGDRVAIMRLDPIHDLGRDLAAGEAAIRLIWLRFVIGMMPGGIGMSIPASRPGPRGRSSPRPGRTCR